MDAENQALDKGAGNSFHASIGSCMISLLAVLALFSNQNNEFVGEIQVHSITT